MRVMVSSVESTPILEVVGEVDIHTAPSLDDWLAELLDGGASRVVVDLRKVEFLDSTGLGVLVRAHKRLAVHGSALDVVVHSDAIAKLFAITGLDSVLRMHATVDEALAL